jgi:O-antigen/teichoic acid export membrane protein
MLDSVSVTSSPATALPRLPVIRIARRGAIAVGIRVGGAGLALALQVILARVLGHTGYGRYAYVVAWLQLMLIFAQGGLTTAALRYVAEYRARNQAALVRGFLRRSSQLVFLESIVCALCVAACATILKPLAGGSVSWHFVIVAATLPFLAHAALSSAIVRGLGHALLSMSVDLAQPLLLLMAVLFSAYLLQLRISPTTALLLHFGAAAGALGIVFRLRRQMERPAGRESHFELRDREWIGAAAQMMLVSAMIYLQGRTGVIVTGQLLDAHATGTYAAMERLADVALLGLTSMNLLVAPRFSALHAEGRRLDLQRYARLAALGSSSIMFAVTVPMIFFGKPLLRLFGDEFVSGYPALMILLVGVAVNATTGSVALLLNMTGHHRAIVMITLVSCCVNVILSLTLIPRYGIIGTAVAFAASTALANVVLMLTVRRRLGIWACVGTLH